MKMIKKISFLFLCLVTVLPSITSASINKGDEKVSSSYSYYDAGGSLIEISQESDGTIVVYVNGELDHSAKTDLTTGTVVSTEYFRPDNKNDNNVMKEKLFKEDTKVVLEKTTIYRIDDFIEELDFIEENVISDNIVNVENALEATILSTFPPSWPYNQGYSYRNSYNNDQRNLIAHGYYRDEAPVYTSGKKVSFLRNISIGTAVALVITALGGAITISVVAGAIAGAVGSAILDGIFTQHVDVNAHYKTEMEQWLAVVGNYNYYTQKGTKYLRILNFNGPGESTEEVGPVGFAFDFTEFLRSSSWN